MSSPLIGSPGRALVKVPPLEHIASIADCVGNWLQPPSLFLLWSFATHFFCFSVKFLINIVLRCNDGGTNIRFRKGCNWFSLRTIISLIFNGHDLFIRHRSIFVFCRSLKWGLHVIITPWAWKKTIAEWNYKDRAKVGGAWGVRNRFWKSEESCSYFHSWSMCPYSAVWHFLRNVVSFPSYRYRCCHRDRRCNGHCIEISTARCARESIYYSLLFSDNCANQSSFFSPPLL